MVYTLSFLVNTDTEEVSNPLVVDMDESIHVHVYVCVCVRASTHAISVTRQDLLRNRIQTVKKKMKTAIFYFVRLVRWFLSLLD